MFGLTGSRPPGSSTTATEDLFPRCLPLLLRLEGGYSNVSADPGGETKYGISRRAYPELPSIKDLTVDAASQIYRRDYWNKAGCAELAWPACLVHFDAAVNHGVGRARRMLVQAHGEPVAYLQIREAFYRGLAERRPASKVFLKGWLRRLRVVAAEGGIPYQQEAA